MAKVCTREVSKPSNSVFASHMQKKAYTYCRHKERLMFTRRADVALHTVRHSDLQAQS